MTQFTELSLKEYLSQLASDQPVPGGGSVAAYVGSLAMGLTQMVGRIALKRKKKPDLTPEENEADDEKRAAIQQIVDAVEQTKESAFHVVDLDPDVYEEVMNAWKAGDEAMQAALDKSYRIQANLASLIVEAKEENLRMSDLITGSIKNDLLVSASLSEAAFRGAYHTAMINVKYMGDESKKAQAENELHDLKTRFEKG